MSYIKRIAVLALAMCLFMTYACAEDWRSAYLGVLSEGVARKIGLCEIGGDSVPELIDIVVKGSTGSLSIKSQSSGDVKKMTSDGFDFSDFSVRKLKAAKIVSRESEDGEACVFIRLLGADDDVRLGFTASGANKLDARLNVRKTVSGRSVVYYVNNSAVSAEKYQKAVAAFNSSYKKLANVTLKSISVSDGAAVIKKKFKALASGFDAGDADPTAIKLSDTSLNLTAGDTHTLKASLSPSNASGGVDWSSSVPKVAAVSANGLVTALSKGSAVITATTRNGLSAKCKIKVTASQGGKEAVIVDISQHNNASGMNWDKIAANVDLLILRCGVTRTYTAPIGVGVDDSFAYFAKMCKKYEIPFGVYYYGKCSTIEEAKEEARMTWNTASSYDPLFYVYDAEETRLTKKLIETYMTTLQGLGAKKTGYYIANHLYSTYKLDTGLVDFIWIPRYDGNAPVYDCDIHQYTSTGKVEGFPGVVDVNRLTGTKPLKWFLS